MEPTVVSGYDSVPGTQHLPKQERQDVRADHEYIYRGPLYLQCESVERHRRSDDDEKRIFKFLIGERSFATSMADVYGYSNLVNLGTCIFVILLVFFVFNHPKYQTVRKTEIPDYMMNYLRVTFLAGAAAFLIPAGICLASAVRGEVVLQTIHRWRRLTAGPSISRTLQASVRCSPRTETS